MKIGVLGTGMVGNTIGSKLIELGHEVKMGSRTSGNEKAIAWTASAGGKASEGTFADAAAFGELLFNCTSGMASLEVMKQAGESNLKNKILIDISNPLDFSKGMPPSLSVCNTDSIGEQIQRSYPDLKVVKALNTLNCRLMVNPEALPGEHEIFICANDEQAKGKAKKVLNSFGWSDDRIHDLGDITGARSTEMILPIWVRLMGRMGTPQFNFHIVK
jgi:predicted dinucleotide-binding enzyme